MQVRFNVITLEARGDDELKDAETRLFLETKGYTFYSRQASRFFSPSIQVFVIVWSLMLSCKQLWAPS